MQTNFRNLAESMIGFVSTFVRLQVSRPCATIAISATLLLNANSSNAENFVLSSSPNVGRAPQALTGADVNRDGWPDLIVPNNQDNTVMVLTNNGNGTFMASSTNRVRAPGSVVAADVNGDGWLDLIASNADTNTLTVLTNNGDGTFNPASTNIVGLGPQSVVAADVNRDGKLDLVTGNWAYDFLVQGNTLTVLTNNGDGTFTLSATLSVGLSPSTVIAADIDGDGNLDLISANVDDNTLTVLTNDGTGNFTQSVTLSVGSGPHAVVSADVNGDGYLDLISANTFENTLSILRNNGHGSFKYAATYSVGNGPWDVVAADMNGDGKVDLISADSGEGGGNTLTVLTNNGSGIFKRSETLRVGKAPFFVVAADVNRDGTTDLVSANYRNNTLTVLLNSPQPPRLNLQFTSDDAFSLRWSTAWPDFALQHNSDLITTNWESLTNAVTGLGGQNQVLLAPSMGTHFYRLVHQ
jgi:hypothetical protein